MAGAGIFLCRPFSLRKALNLNLFRANFKENEEEP